MPQFGEVRVDFITFTTGVSPEASVTVPVSGLVQSPTFSGDVVIKDNLDVEGNITASGTVSSNAGIFASGTAAAPSVSVGTTNNGLYSPGANQVAISTSGTQRILIDNSGNVGIGSAITGTTPLEVTADTAELFRIHRSASSNGSAELAFYGGSVGGELATAKISSSFTSIDNLSRETQLIFSTLGSSLDERMRIDSAGNVGIGTISPTNVLHVYSTNNTSARFESSTSASYIRFKDPNGDAFLGNVGNDIAFYTSSSLTERMRIDSSGNVGIGTTTPGAELDITRTSANAELYINSSGGTGKNYQLRSLTNGRFSLGNSATNHLLLIGDNVSLCSSAGNVGIGTTSPSVLLHIASSEPQFYIQDANSTGNAVNATFQFRDSSNTQLSYFGFASGSDSDLSVFNTMSGGALRFGTASTERMRIDSSGNVGIGTSTPKEKLDSRGAAVFSGDHVTGANAYGTAHGIMLSSSSGVASIKAVSNGSNNVAIRFAPLSSGSSSEAMRIDSSGRLLVGYSSAATAGNSQYAKLQVHGGSGLTSAVLSLKRAQAAASISNNTLIGTIAFGDEVGNPYADINCESDAASGSGDYPGRLVFSTTSDSASTPTERLRIDSSGNLLFQQESASSPYPEQKLKWSNDSTTANGFYISQDTSRNGRVWHEQGLDILFGTTNTERMRINSNGLVNVTGGIQVTENVTPTSGSGVEIFKPSSTVGQIQAYNRTGAAWMDFIIKGNTQQFHANGSERMRIDSSGNVGIGTTSPTSDGGTTLEIYNTSTPTLRLNDGGDYKALFQLRGNDLEVRGSSGAMEFYTGSADGASSTERMRIDSSGNVLVGKTASNFANAGVEIRPGGEITLTRQGDLLTTRRVTTEGTHLSFRNISGTIVGSVATTSSSTAFNTSSDYRLKENVVNITDGITRVKQLQPKRFNFIADAETTVDGFLAHEAQTVVPEAVTGTHNEVDDDGNAVMQGIDQSKLVPLLTAALQEAIAKIETLETKVAALEAG